MLVFFMSFMLYYNVTISVLIFPYFIFLKAFSMIAFTRTHSKTALLCFAFLLVGAGCEQKPETPPQSDDATATDASTDTTHEDHEHDAHTDHDEHAHDEHADHEEHDHGHEGHHHDAADMTTYACQPEQEIKAHYDPENSTQSATSAHLLIDGIEYDLTAMTLPKNSNAGAAYETDIGIANDAGMRWQVSADATKAILSNKTLDNSVAESNEALLFDCQKTDS